MKNVSVFLCLERQMGYDHWEFCLFNKFITIGSCAFLVHAKVCFNVIT